MTDRVTQARGRPSLGPYPKGSTALALPLDAVFKAVPAGVDAADFTGLLQPFNGRARAALLALLRGAPIKSAATAAGVHIDTFSRWRRDHPSFDEAVRLCFDAGSVPYEVELHARALAGPDDRGSMRALELVVRARNPEYREKASSVQVDALSAMKSVLMSARGWPTHDAR